MHKLLFVEDNEDFQEVTTDLLSTHFDVRVVGDIKSARAALESEPFDLVLLDVTLPDGSGYELCGFIKNNESLRETPVLMLSGNMDVSAKVTSFELGADDYIEKPFTLEELLARIKSKIKKAKVTNSHHPQKIGSFIIDNEKLKIFIAEGRQQELQLSKTEYLILSCMIRNEGRVYSRDELIRLCRGEDVFVTDRAMDTHIYALRKKIKDDYGEIVTHYGSGYSFKLQR